MSSNSRAGHCPALLLIVSLSVIATLTAQNTGGIQGTAFDSSGKPSAETLVRAVRVQPTRWTSPPAATSTTGAFALSGLAPGEYILCAIADPKRLQVDPCFWLDPARKTITIASRQTVTSQQVRLDLGRLVAVRVKDAAQILKSAQPTPSAAGARPRILKVEITGPPGAAHRDLTVTRTEPGGVLVHEILLPIAGPKRLRIFAQSLQLRDAQQRALPNNRHDEPVNPGNDSFDFQVEAN